MVYRNAQASRSHNAAIEPGHWLSGDLMLDTGGCRSRGVIRDPCGVHLPSTPTLKHN